MHVDAAQRGGTCIRLKWPDASVPVGAGGGGGRPIYVCVGGGGRPHTAANTTERLYDFCTAVRLVDRAVDRLTRCLSSLSGVFASQAPAARKPSASTKASPPAKAKPGRAFPSRQRHQTPRHTGRYRYALTFFHLRLEKNGRKGLVVGQACRQELLLLRSSFTSQNSIYPARCHRRSARTVPQGQRALLLLNHTIPKV